ncbi:MAG: hypothetical protein ACRC2T_09070, partial [Thermoguttaceae bacterium]
ISHFDASALGSHWAKYYALSGRRTITESGRSVLLRQMENRLYSAANITIFYLRKEYIANIF